MLARLLVLLAFVCMPALWQTTPCAESVSPTTQHSSSSVCSKADAYRNVKTAFLNTGASSLMRVMNYGHEQVRLVGQRVLWAVVSLLLLLSMLKSIEITRLFSLTPQPLLQRVNNRCGYYIYGLRHIIR